MTQFVKLFEPGRIGKIELKNRVIMPPMLTRYTVEGSIPDRMVEYYTERARSGAALITSEPAYIRKGGYPGRIRIDTDDMIPGLSRLADGIHRGGAKASIQVIAHRGRSDVDPAGPSESVHPATGAKIRAVALEDIKRLTGEFGEATRRVKEAGFDCLQIHVSGGCLVSDFLCARLNKRTDEYGGSPRGRAKFAMELVSEAKKKTGGDFPIIVRLMCDERLEGGYGVKDAVEIARLLEEAGAAAIDVVSGGLVETFQWVIPYMYMRNGSNLDLAEVVKKAVKIPISVSGKILEPELAEQVLTEGMADFIGLGRALLADPRFLQKAKAGKLTEICKCVACLRCAEAILKPPEMPMVCTVNPAVGREKEFQAGMKPAVKKKKVLVIGGGPGGMEAALVAAQRGHRVTLWEKEKMLGGTLNLAVVPPGKDDLKSFLEHLTHRLDELKVTVKLEKEATVDAVKAFSPDAVVVASGSTPLIPKIKGSEKRKILTFRDILTGKAATGKNVVVVGGGFVGCEVADFLAEKGKKVTIVEILPGLATELFFTVTNLINQRLRELGVQAYTAVKEEEITGSGMNVVDKDGKTVSLKADDIVIAVGSVADRSVFESLKGVVPELYEVGDCAKARRMQEAVSEGATVGMKI